MADTPYTRINEHWRLAYDRFQWVLQRHSKRNDKDDWKAVAFTDGTKYRLFAMMIRYGVPKDDALDVCEQLPKTFTEFLADTGATTRRLSSDSAISGQDEGRSQVR